MRFAAWPDNKRAAISLTFDDAAPSQLEHAVPILDRYGLRGTFYVNPGEGSAFELRIDAWRRVHTQGHELGNHTVSHPCSRQHAFVVPERALESWTLERIEADIDQATERLTRLIPGYTPSSFAYPCGETFVGEGAARRSYIPSVARRFLVARGVGWTDNDLASCDLHNLGSWVVQGVTAEQMISMIQPTIAGGRWGIFCFHGVGGDHLSVDPEALEGLVRYLKERESEIWTDTVAAIGAHVAKARLG